MWDVISLSGAPTALSEPSESPGQGQACPQAPAWAGPCSNPAHPSHPSHGLLVRVGPVPSPGQARVTTWHIRVAGLSGKSGGAGRRWPMFPLHPRDAEAGPCWPAGASLREEKGALESTAITRGVQLECITFFVQFSPNCASCCRRSSSQRRPSAGVAARAVRWVLPSP